MGNHYSLFARGISDEDKKRVLKHRYQIVRSDVLDFTAAGDAVGLFGRTFFRTFDVDSSVIVDL